MQALGSIVFTTFLFFWTIGYAAFFVLVGGFMSHRRRFSLIEWYAERIFDVLRVTCKLDYRVEGLENIPDEPHVAYWKHSSAWETFGQFLVGPPKVIVLKHELMYIPFVGFGLWLLRSIDVRRGAQRTIRLSARDAAASPRGSRFSFFRKALAWPPARPVDMA